MMRPMKTLTLLSLAALLASCTEEISDELKNSQNSTSQNTTTDLSDSKIQLKHLMDDRMSFSLHKAGTVDSPCELTPPDANGFDASTYYRDPSLSPKPQVIDCILEGQEQDIYNAGAKFELKVDAQLCEYVSYTPFKYVERQFGSTTKTVYRVSCESDCPTAGNVCDRVYDNAVGYGPTISAAGLTNAVNYDNYTCQFDYSGNGGPNCDNGSVQVIDLLVDNTRYDDDGDANTPEICPAIDAPIEYNGDSTDYCGGDHGACFGGPAVDLLPTPYYGGEIYENTDLKEFVKDWEIKAPIDRQDDGGAVHNNMYLANFSRVCSDYDQVKVEDGTDYSVYNAITLKGHHVENVAYDVSNLPNRITTQEYFDPGGQSDYIAMAENPWRSVYLMSPYYSFKCLDQARDVKAQIRLFIREWDRNYDEPISTFAMVSDIGTVVPLIDSNDSHDDDPWNDYTDWDDFFTKTDQFVWLNNQCRDTSTPYDPSIFPGDI